MKPKVSYLRKKTKGALCNRPLNFVPSWGVVPTVWLSTQTYIFVCVCVYIHTYSIFVYLWQHCRDCNQNDNPLKVFKLATVTSHCHLVYWSNLCCIFLSLISHEYISGYYRLSVYFLSKILSDIITLRTIPAIVFTCVAYFMIGG